jgi:hypothetical protein
MKRIYLCLVIASMLTNVSFTSVSFAKEEDCYPITFFTTIEKAVAQYKKLNTEPNPILLPAWSPNEATLESVRIVGCGMVLKTEYIIEDKQAIRVHVYPKIHNSKFTGGDIALKDGTIAKHKETDLFYFFQFNKEGRSYNILIDKKNQEMKKEMAIEYFTKTANSMARL